MKQMNNWKKVAHYFIILLIVPLKKTFPEISLFQTILFSIVVIGFASFVTSENGKNIRNKIGTWVDHLLDDLINKFIFKEVNSAELINYLGQGRIDPRISCTSSERKRGYSNCERDYCRFGSQETRTLSEHKIRELTKNKVDLSRIRGFKPLNLNVHLNIDKEATKSGNIKQFYPIKASLYSWSYNGCRMKFSERYNELDFIGRIDAYILFKKGLFFPTFNKVFVTASKRIKNDNKNLILEYKITNPEFKIKKKALTASKIAQNNDLHEELFFCKTDDHSKANSISVLKVI